MAIKKFFAYLYDTVAKSMKLGDTSGSNYTQFDANGRLKNIGNAEMWDDIIGHRVSGVNALTPTLTTVKGNLKEPAFTNNGTDEEFWIFEIMHNTKLNSLVDLHFHADIAATANSGNVKMLCEYWLCHDGDPIPDGVILPDTKAIVGTNNAFGVTFIFTTTLDISSLTIGDHIKIRITRDNTVASNLNANVFSVQAGVHRQIDGFGSNERLTKNY